MLIIRTRTRACVAVRVRACACVEMQLKSRNTMHVTVSRDEWQCRGSRRNQRIGSITTHVYARIAIRPYLCVAARKCPCVYSVSNAAVDYDNEFLHKSIVLRHWAIVNEMAQKQLNKVKVLFLHALQSAVPIHWFPRLEHSRGVYYFLDIFIHHRGGRNKQKKTVITITTKWKKEVT